MRRAPGAIADLIERLRKAKEAHDTRRMLHGLSDHMLRDLGLRREQIELVGREGLFQSRLRR